MGHVLFGFSGRINRAKWWLSALVIILLPILVMTLLVLLVPPDVTNANPNLGPIVVLVLAIIVLWMSLAAGAKRLHDSNRSGGWLVLFVGAPLVLFAILVAYVAVVAGTAIMAGETPNEADLLRIGGVALIIFVVWLALAVWGFIWFGCLRGTVGPNQYGPDPLEGRF